MFKGKSIANDITGTFRVASFCLIFISTRFVVPVVCVCLLQATPLPVCHDCVYPTVLQPSPLFFLSTCISKTILTSTSLSLWQRTWPSHSSFLFLIRFVSEVLLLVSMFSFLRWPCRLIPRQYISILVSQEIILSARCPVIHAYKISPNTTEFYHTMCAMLEVECCTRKPW